MLLVDSYEGKAQGQDTNNERIKTRALIDFSNKEEHMLDTAQ